MDLRIENDDSRTLVIDSEFWDDTAGVLVVCGSEYNDKQIFIIAKVNVSLGYRGMGLYKLMILHTLKNICKGVPLVSRFRVEQSNEIYKRWVGRDIKMDTPVFMTLGDQGEIIFTTDCSLF